LLKCGLGIDFRVYSWKKRFEQGCLFIDGYCLNVGIIGVDCLLFVIIDIYLLIFIAQMCVRNRF